MARFRKTPSVVCTLIQRTRTGITQPWKRKKEPSLLHLKPSPTWYRRDQRPDLSRWEIPLCGELTDRQAELLEQVSEVPRNSRGLMYFDSCGGSVYTGLALATFNASPWAAGHGVVIGECSSAALLPFAACQKRLVTPHSTLLFHPMRWQSDEDVKLEEATEWARHFKDLNHGSTHFCGNCFT